MISSDEDKTDKKIYSKISLTKRMAFIKKVLTEKQSVKAAAEQCQIKFSTAKAILKIFRNEGRLGKKSKLSQLLNQIQGQNEEENLLKIVEEEKLRKQQKQEEKEKEHKQLASRLNIFCGEQPKEPEPDVCYIKLAETLYTMVQQEQQKYNYLVAQVNYMSMFRMMM